MDVEGSKLARMVLPSSSMSLNSAKLDKSIGDTVPVAPPWPASAGESVGVVRGDGVVGGGYVPMGSWSPNSNRSLYSSFCPP